MMEEEIPARAFPDGIKLRGYDRPKENQLQCSGHKKPDVIDMDLETVRIMEKHGFKAYTIEIYFTHCPPMIRRSSASVDADEFAIVYADLEDLSIEKLEMIEMIEIEYANGEVYEFTEEEIEELRTVIAAMQRGGFVRKKDNIYPWNQIMPLN